MAFACLYIDFGAGRTRDDNWGIEVQNEGEKKA